MARRDGIVERPESIPADTFARSIAASDLDNDDPSRPAATQPVAGRHSKTASSVRTVEIDALLAFTFDHDCWSWPTWKVVRDIVKPATVGGDACSFAELDEMVPFTKPLVHGGGAIYVCHCWGAAWGDVVLSSVHGAYNPRRHVFIDILCLDQNDSNSDVLLFREIIPMCAAMIVAAAPLPSLHEFIISSEDDVGAFLTSVKGHHARLVNPFFRLSCIVEIAQAALSEVTVVVKCGSAVATPDPRPFANRHCVHFDTESSRESNMLQNLVSGLIDVEAAACHSPTVRRQIISAIESLDGDGFALVEAAVEGELVSAISSMAYSLLEVEAAACGEFGALNALDIPEGCAGDKRNLAGNVLLAACAGNRYNVVRRLLRHWSGTFSNDESDNEEGVLKNKSIAATDWVRELINESLAVWSASNAGHSRVVEVLLSVPGVLGAETVHAGYSALHIASKHGHTGVVRALLRGPIKSRGHLNVVNHSQGPTNSMRPTINLSSLADASCVFQSMRTLVNRPTPFTVAVEHGHAGVVQELLEASEDGLLDMPINVNSKILGKQLPLQYAIAKGFSELARVLRNAGARDGKERQRDEVKMLKLGCSGNAEELKEIFQSWLPGGSKSMDELKDEEEMADDGMHSPSSPQAALASAAARRLCKMVDNCRVLWHAAAAGHAKIVELLLSIHKELMKFGFGINTNICVADGSTALFVACERGFIDVVETLLECSEVDVNACDDNNTTPLNVACYDGRKAIVKLLLSIYEVDLTIKDDWGDTALSTARNGRFKEVYAMVQRASQVQLARSLR
eukprot:g963.t1